MDEIYIRHLLNDDLTETIDNGSRYRFDHQFDFSSADDGWEVDVFRGHYESDVVVGEKKLENGSIVLYNVRPLDEVWRMGGYILRWLSS